jgi:hypothetical protein
MNDALWKRDFFRGRLGQRAERPALCNRPPGDGTFDWIVYPLAASGSIFYRELPLVEYHRTGIPVPVSLSTRGSSDSESAPRSVQLFVHQALPTRAFPRGLNRACNRGFVRSTITDGNGRFILEPVPSGRYDFRTSARGYAVLERPVVVRGGDSHRDWISVTALVPVDQQTVSVVELMRRRSPSVVPKGNRGQVANRQETLR